ncbi:MAG: carboxypeptidase regulatory-like domain-containing protein [Nitrospinota bacterium]
MRNIISITPRFLIAFAFTMLLAACGGGGGSGAAADGDTNGGGGGGTTETGTVSGVAKDVSGNPLSGVTVEIFVGETITVTGPSSKPSADGASTRQAALVTTTTASDGSYTLTGVLVDDDYVITYTISAYVVVYMYDVDVTANATEIVEAVRIVPESSFTGGASGTITDALTGDAVSGATVTVYSGMGNTSGTVVSTTTTDSSGIYSLTGLDAGNYTVQISKTGFQSSSFSIYVVGATTTSDQNGAATPTLSSGETRIILTWGVSPSDLDSHLLGPYADGSGSQFHIYFGNKTYSSGGSAYADLDLDDVSSYGPETTTIYTQSTGAYTFCVYNFSNGGSSSSTVLANSEAQVNVYQGSSLLGRFNVPNSGGTVWKVFTLSGTSITPVNTMSYETLDTNVCAN